MWVSRFAGALLILLGFSVGVLAEEFPLKRVRVIEPFGAGSGVDTTPRPVMEKLSQTWGEGG